MKLTFIITTYNLRPAQIRRCLASLLRQNVSTDDYEVIVVDDGSDESPQHIVDEFAEEMNVRFFRQEHARQGAARNLAFHQAEGEFIQIVDGDDYLFAGSVHRILTSIEEYHLDMLIYDFNHAADTARIAYCPHIVTRTDFYRGTDYMRSHTIFGSSCTMCFRRSLLALDSDEPILFPEGIAIEDEDFVTRLVWHTPRLGVTDLVAYAYVPREDSTTRSRDAAQVEQRYADTFTVLDRLIAFRNDLAETIPASSEGVDKGNADTLDANVQATEQSPVEVSASVGLSSDTLSGLDRKIHFLAIDILRHALREPDWETRFPVCADLLRARSLGGTSLFPLPRASWSSRYAFFRRLSRHPRGIRILRWYEQAQKGPKGHMPSFGGTMSDAFRRFRIFLRRKFGKKATIKSKKATSIKQKAAPAEVSSPTKASLTPTETPTITTAASSSTPLVQKPVTGISAFFHKAATSVASFFKKIMASLAPFFSKVVDGIRKVTAGITPFFKKITAAIGPFFTKAAKSIKRALSGIVPFFKKVIANIAPFFKKVGANIQKITASIAPFFKKVSDNVGPFFKKVGEHITTLWQTILTKCRSFIGMVREKWVPAIINFGKKCIEDLRTFIARLTKKDE